MSEITKKEVGDFGENACVKYIKRLGFKVLARNSRLGHLETDIIATDKNFVYFIEVKTRRVNRNNLGRGADAINASKRTNLLKFAYYYIKTLPKKHSIKQPRMDVCEIYVNEENGKLVVCDLNYIENAFSR